MPSATCTTGKKVKLPYSMTMPSATWTTGKKVKLHRRAHVRAELS